MKKEKNFDHLFVIDKHTNRRTSQLYDWPGPEGWVSEILWVLESQSSGLDFLTFIKYPLIFFAQSYPFQVSHLVESAGAASQLWGDWLALTARMGELVTEEDYQYQLWGDMLALSGREDYQCQLWHNETIQVPHKWQPKSATCDNPCL